MKMFTGEQNTPSKESGGGGVKVASPVGIAADSTTVGGSKSTDSQKARSSSLNLASGTILFGGDAEESESTSEDQEDEIFTEPDKEPTLDKSTYFRDGVRKIDYVLVYRSNRWLRDIEEQRTIEKMRENFLLVCDTLGLEAEHEVAEYGDCTYNFIKLHAPLELLCRVAEVLNMRVPIKYHKPMKTRTWISYMLKYLHFKDFTKQDLPYQAPSYYTGRFQREKFESYVGSNKKETFFSPTQRIRIVHALLLSIVYGERKKGEVGMFQLIDQGALEAAYPLHDGDYEPVRVNGKIQLPLNRRQVLFIYWAQYKKWYKCQPLLHIRDYFGEKVAMYFAWIELYTAWLIPYSLCGTLVFIYGICKVWTEPIISHLCQSKDKYKMCPLCFGCKYWDYSDMCLQAKLTYLFGNRMSVYFAVFSSFWSVTFLEFWKRQSATLAFQWDCWDVELEEETLRPEYAARASIFRRNPVTGRSEPSFPRKIKMRRTFFAFLIIIFMISLVIMFVLAVIVYRVLISIRLTRDNMVDVYERAEGIGTFSGSCINFVFIMFMSKLYILMADRLTNWEMPRTNTEYENSLTAKVFMFEFINYYAHIFYVAYFKGSFTGYPGGYRTLFGVRNEDCRLGGCLLELMQQLSILLIGKSVFTSLQEAIIPKFNMWWKKRKKIVPSEKLENQWEKDFLLEENKGLFIEYSQIIWQYGFVTLFVVAFPLAPLVALVANYVEIRVDAEKFVCNSRRPPPEHARNIGVWFDILNILGHLSVITSAFLIAFTTNEVSKTLFYHEHLNMEGYINSTFSLAPPIADMNDCLYEGNRDGEGHFTLSHYKILCVKFGFVLIYEHAVFFICKVISVLVPDVPSSVELKVKRQQFLARQILQSTVTPGGKHSRRFRSFLRDCFGMKPASQEQDSKKK